MATATLSPLAMVALRVMCPEERYVLAVRELIEGGGLVSGRSVADRHGVSRRNLSAQVRRFTRLLNAAVRAEGLDGSECIERYSAGDDGDGQLDGDEG